MHRTVWNFNSLLKISIFIDEFTENAQFNAYIWQFLTVFILMVSSIENFSKKYIERTKILKYYRDVIQET